MIAIFPTTLGALGRIIITAFIAKRVAHPTIEGKNHFLLLHLLDIMKRGSLAGE